MKIDFAITIKSLFATRLLLIKIFHKQYLRVFDLNIYIIKLFRNVFIDFFDILITFNIYIDQCINVINF